MIKPWENKEWLHQKYVVENLASDAIADLVRCCGRTIRRWAGIFGFTPNRRYSGDPFWGRVDKRGPDECWEWTGGQTSAGYGSMGVIDGVYWAAHRYSWMMNNGPIPEGKIICHTCDNKSCVNPSHIYAGNHSTNMRDRLARRKAKAL